MKRFSLAATFAAVVGLASADTASAQYTYGYNNYNPYTGGVNTYSGVATPFAAQQNYGYYNPYTGSSGQRTLYQNAFGTSVYRSYGGNPYYGRGYNNGYYNPGFGASPYAGNYYRYRW